MAKSGSNRPISIETIVSQGRCEVAGCVCAEQSEAFRPVNGTGTLYLLYPIYLTVNYMLSSPLPLSLQAPYPGAWDGRTSMEPFPGSGTA